MRARAGSASSSRAAPARTSRSSAPPPVRSSGSRTAGAGISCSSPPTPASSPGSRATSSSASRSPPAPASASRWIGIRSRCCSTLAAPAQGSRLSLAENAETAENAERGRSEAVLRTPPRTSASSVVQAKATGGAIPSKDASPCAPNRPPRPGPTALGSCPTSPPRVRLVVPLRVGAGAARLVDRAGRVGAGLDQPRALARRLDGLLARHRAGDLPVARLGRASRLRLRHRAQPRGGAAAAQEAGFVELLRSLVITVSGVQLRHPGEHLRRDPVGEEAASHRALVLAVEGQPVVARQGVDAGGRERVDEDPVVRLVETRPPDRQEHVALARPGRRRVELDVEVADSKRRRVDEQVAHAPYLTPVGGGDGPAA